LFQFGSYQSENVQRHLEIFFEEKPEVLLAFCKLMVRDKVTLVTKKILKILKQHKFRHPEKDFLTE